MTLERAKRIAKQWANGYVCSLREGEAEEYHKLCFSALRAKQENPSGGWISVEDRLPELGERVLCTDGNCVFEQYRVLPSCVYGVWDRMGLKSEMQDVTHWMPLPCPPQEV